MDIKSLHEERNSLLDLLESTLEKAEAEKRSFNAKEKSIISDSKSRISEIDRQLEMENESKGEQRMIKAPLKEDRAQIEKEERAFIEAIKEGRASGLAAGSNGSLIPTSIASRVWERIIQVSPIIKQATRLSVGGNLVLPTHDYSTYTVGFVTELTAITANATNFTGITLSNKIVACLTQISKSLVNQADINIVQIVVNELAMAIALFLEKEILQNTNAKFTNTLKGITNSYTTATTLQVAPEEIVKLMALVPAPAQANASFVMHQATYSYLMQLKDTTGRFLFNYDFGLVEGFSKPVPMLMGKPVYFSDNCDQISVAGRQIYFGDFSNVVIKEGSPLQMQVLQERFADSYALGVIASTEIDVGLPLSNAIAVMIGK